MGLPSRSFAADAHDCIMVGIRMDSTEYKGVARCSAPNGELPSDHPRKRDGHDRQWKVSMPRHRIGTAPMTPAERQAQRRAKLRRQTPLPPVTPTRRITPRPTRWAAAVAALVDLQEEYRTWLDNLPQSLESSKLADKLQTIVELDLEELQAIDPPRGYGRD